MFLNELVKEEGWTLEACQVEDMSQLSELRLRAIMPSLKAVNRFEAIQIVQGFAKDFVFHQAFKILLDNEFIGFFMIVEERDAFYLPHFYIDPNVSNHQIGKSVLEALIKQSNAQQKGLKVSALKDCQQQALYQSLGFAKAEEMGWARFYECPPLAHSSSALANA